MYLNGMEQDLRLSGLEVQEVPGWTNRNLGALKAVKTIVIHHTAGSATGDYPSLGVVTNGRKDLKGPLAQVGVGRSGKVYLVGNGIANHAGTVRDSTYGNSYSIGIEVESVGTGVSWPDAQVHAVAKAAAVLCKRYGLTVGRVLGHKEICNPPGRKVDPVGIPGDMNALRSLVQVYLDRGFDNEEDDLKVKICRWSGSESIWAVTPLGHWKFNSIQDMNDFAYKWDLPRDVAGNAFIEVNDRVGWFGPNLTDLMNNAAIAAQEDDDDVS